MTHNVASGDTLRGLAEFYFGDPGYWPSIVLATNSRAGLGFRRISREDSLKETPKVCIPGMMEAERWRSRYEQYEKAVAEAAVPERWQMVNRLVEFPPDRPLDVVSWIREDQLRFYRVADHWVDRAPEEIWVTVEPYLRMFCADFLGSHGRDVDQLTLRLEQRLGLPPVSNKARFLEIRLTRPAANVIFRPCLDPATNITDCPVGPPPDKADSDHRNWIYKQYYSSYGVERLDSFPWTALGYTFDWASSPQPGQFARIGESEFVIRQGAPVDILREQSTADYCNPN